MVELHANVLGKKRESRICLSPIPSLIEWQDLLSQGHRYNLAVALYTD